MGADALPLLLELLQLERAALERAVDRGELLEELRLAGIRGRLVRCRIGDASL